MPWMKQRKLYEMGIKLCTLKFVTALDVCHRIDLEIA